MKHVGAIVLASAVAVFGCAACGNESHHGHARRSAAQANDVLVGHATGQAFVKWFSANMPTFPSGLDFAFEYHRWITGRNTASVVNAPLDPAAKHAAETVALAYAARLIADGKLPADSTNGENLLTYMKAHGV